MSKDTNVTLNIIGKSSGVKEVFREIEEDSKRVGQNVSRNMDDFDFSRGKFNDENDPRKKNFQQDSSENSNSRLDGLIEEVRNQSANQGKTYEISHSTRVAIEDVKNNRAALNDESISKKYNNERKSLEDDLNWNKNNIEEEYAKKREDGLAKLGGSSASSWAVDSLDRGLDRDKSAELKKANSIFSEESEDLNEREKAEKEIANKELVIAIKELTDFFKRNGVEYGTATQTDSYLGNLRSQQRELIQQRDSATSKKGANEASKKLAKINKKMSEAMNGDTESSSMKAMRYTVGGAAVIEQLGQGNWEGAMMNAALMTKNPYVIGGAAVVAGGSKLLTATGDDFKSVSDLAALRGTTGLSGGDATRRAKGLLNMNDYYGLKTGDLGLSEDEFGVEASSRVKKRGMSENWYQETFKQIGLESSLALNKGALAEGGKFDRYGENVTDAISKMVVILNDIPTAGIKKDGKDFADFTRVQEKFDIQQSIMQGYMSRTDKPNYDSANKMLAAFSSVDGITQDSRLGDDIQHFQKMIQKPVNNRMKSIINSTIAELFPETAGRSDLIDQARRDPEKEGQIMQAVVSKLTTMFGSGDTKEGYWMQKAAIGEGIPFDRLNKEWNQIGKGEGLGGGILAKGIGNEEQYNIAGKNKAVELSVQASEYYTTTAKTFTDIFNVLKNIRDRWAGTAEVISPRDYINMPKTGGNR